MLGNVVALVILLAVTLGLAWLVRRSFGAKRKIVRWGGSPIAGFFTLIFAVSTVAAMRGIYTTYSPRGRAVPTLTVERTPERIARGEHIARAWCASCHSMNGDVPLSGGKNLSDEAHMPLGNITPVNLTPGGPLKDWTDGQIFRAIRDGADPNGRPLVVMRAQPVRNLSDEDIQSVIAYLRSQPAVSQETAPETLSLLSMVMAGAGMLPNLPGYAPEKIVAPTRGPTKEYGQYVVSWAGCDECHGADYNGGGGGVMPKGPSLHATKGWTPAQFITTLRTGTNPFGKNLDSLMMPWTFVRRLDDDELTAVHAYLTSLPAPAPAKR